MPHKKNKQHPKYNRIDGYQAVFGKSNEEMAEALGCSVRTYRDKVNGSRDFSLRELRILCSLFGRSADELLHTDKEDDHD